MTSLTLDWEKVARANTHPIRISILEILALDGGRVLSPNELSHELQVPKKLSKVSYHVDTLYEQGLLELVDEQQRRGAVEHFYELADAPAE